MNLLVVALLTAGLADQSPCAPAADPAFLPRPEPVWFVNSPGYMDIPQAGVIPVSGGNFGLSPTEARARLDEVVWKVTALDGTAIEGDLELVPETSLMIWRSRTLLELNTDYDVSITAPGMQAEIEVFATDIETLPLEGPTVALAPLTNCNSGCCLPAPALTISVSSGPSLRYVLFEAHPRTVPVSPEQFFWSDLDFRIAPPWALDDEYCYTISARNLVDGAVEAIAYCVSHDAHEWPTEGLRWCTGLDELFNTDDPGDPGDPGTCSASQSPARSTPAVMLLLLLGALSTLRRFRLHSTRS